MLNLLTSPRAGRTVRGLIGNLIESAATAVRSLAPAEVEPTTAPEPAGLYTDEEMPETANIERAALGYDLASDNARQADRAKRKHRKLLDRLPAGRYGAWFVERVVSSRETPDLVAIRATYERLGLGDVPMRQVAPSLKVRRAAAALSPVETELVEVAA